MTSKKEILSYHNILLFIVSAVAMAALLMFAAACTADQINPGPDSSNSDPYLTKPDPDNSLQQENDQAGYPADDSDHAENSNGQNEPEPVPKLPYIGIYSGAGSWDTNVEAFGHFFDFYEYEWAEFDQHDALSPDFLSNFDLLWFPGGGSADYKYNIKDHSVIRSFVENGGMLAGTCAGAYYAADIMSWFGDEYEYPLGLFKGKSIGPLSGLVGWGEITALTLNKDLDFNSDFNSNVTMYYFDGPYFSPDEPDSVIVLASYEVNKQPAVIAGSYGLGKYLLFGPHPELGGYSSSSPDFNLNGGEGAFWPWLHQSILWFCSW